MVESLTVRMQRVNVEMLGSSRSVIISDVASSQASLQVAEERGLGERQPAYTAGSLERLRLVYLMKFWKGPFPLLVSPLVSWVMVSTLKSGLLSGLTAPRLPASLKQA